MTTKKHPLSGMLGQFEVMDNATMNDSIHAMATNVNNSLLITGDTSGWVSVSCFLNLKIKRVLAY